MASRRLYDTRHVNRNVMVGDRRTSVRLEPEFWAGLDAMALARKVERAAVVESIYMDGGSGSFASRVRVAVLGYYRELAASSSEQRKVT